MKYIYIIISILFYNFCVSQNNKNLDSLKYELHESKTDSEAFENLNHIIKSYLTISMDSTRIYNDKLLKLSKSTKNKDIAIKGYNLSSTYYYYNAQLDSCLLLVKKSLSLLSDSKDFKMRSDIYRKLSILSRANSDFEGYESYAKQSFLDAKKSGDWELIASSLVVLGNIFYNKNDFSKALKQYLEVDSLHTVNKSKTSNLCLAYENIALIYLELKNEEALFYLDKSMAVHKALNNNSGVSNCIRLKGNFYHNQKDYPAAIKYLSEALLFYETLGEPNKLIEIYSEIIPTYAYTGNFKKAETLVEKGLEIISQKGFSKFGINAMQYATGIFYLEQKKYSKAIDFFLEAEKSAPSKGTDYYLRERKEISEALKKAYLGQRNFEKAFNINERLLVLVDSLNLQNKEKLTTEIETKYQTEKKEREIAILKSEKELSYQKQKNERNLLLGGLSLTTIAGVFLFLLYRNRQKINTKLKELDTAKSNFFANISHEFRTPLTLIANPIDEALEDETLSDIKRNQFIMAKRNSDRLLSLVNQLLDLSKIDAGQLKLRIQKGNVQKLISGIAESFNYSAEQKKISYHLNIEINNEESWFDSDALEKITVNLLSNAIKYTPLNGSITCTSLIADNTLQFNVKNSGVGFSKNELENIFTRFYQTDEVNEGTGIGLALVKELVELHKGVIKVESKPKAWICFLVTLPVDKKSFKENIIIDATEPKQVYQPTHFVNAVNSDKNEVFEDNDKPILLIVEDNNDVRTLLKQNFEADYNILTAENGEIGTSLAIEHVPDIIISDIMMPVKDGVTLTNELKNNELTSHIPIVLLTAKAGDKNEIKGLEIGADAYITKPFNSKILKTKVTNLIDIRRKLQSRYSQEIVLTPKDIAVTNLDEQFLKKVQQVLEHNLVESSFSVGDFSNAVGMSRMQLHRKIKALTGLSTSEFIRSQRLKLAAELLKASDINIAQVGYSVGFNNHSYFTKCFKEAYNYTPTEYAEIHANR